ncbi:hypothetical protein J4558_08310 [Leptolyngbya sp. 15MV]|nr:hypothetical protein J4558_08310 [Leptolyngbya sp. 15MV]
MPQPEGDHPDILILTHPPKDDKEIAKRAEGKPFEVKRNIPIDLVRAMQQRLTTRPTLGSRRAVIVNPADDLEKSASNALLKSLEEPPVGTFFLLVTHRPARLLATIRSRCRTLRFPPVPDDEIAAMLAREVPDADAVARLAAVSAASGSPGVAREFLALDLGPIEVLMRQLVREGDPLFALRGKLAETIGARPERERIQATLDLARAVVAGAAEDAAPARYPALADAHDRLVVLAAQVPTFNFDPGLLAMEIGTLLASAAPASERAHA